MAKVIEEHVKRSGSAITHFIGMLSGNICSNSVCLSKQLMSFGRIYLVSIAVYVASLMHFALQPARHTHTFNISRR